MPTLIKCCDLAPRAPHMPKAGPDPARRAAGQGGMRGRRDRRKEPDRARAGRNAASNRKQESDKTAEAGKGKERPRPQATMSPLLFDAESAIHSVILTHWQARGIEEGRARKTKGVPNW